MFNFVPQFLKVVFNMTRDLLMSFFTLKLQHHWKHFKISLHTMALGSTQTLTEMSTRNLLGGKGRPARKPGNIIAICEPTV
jgi:hypothetical protein